MTLGGLLLLLLVVAVLVFCSAFFSGLETALFSLKAHQLRRLEDQHPSLKNFIQVFRDKPRRVLSVLLLADVIVNVPLIVLCLFIVWEGPLAVMHIPQWLAAVGIFAVVVLVCDLIPKLLALSAPYRLSAMGVFTLRAIMPLLDRVGDVLEKISEAMVNRIAPARALRSGITDEELETLVEMGEEEGTIQEAEGEMIQEIIKLGNKTAKDCMTPRVDTFALPDDLTNEEAIAQLREKRHRRVPVYADTPDQIVGIIDVKHFLLNPVEHYTENLALPSYVPETMPAPSLLRAFLSHPQGLAVVVDEFGGTEGIITLSDIVEEIISDAAPLGQADLYIEPLENGQFLVSGNARLDDLAEHLGFEFDADGIDTIGGFVFNRLGYLPPSGTQIEIPRLAITVRRTARKRIEEMLLQKTNCLTEDCASDRENGAEAGFMIWFAVLGLCAVSFLFAGIEAGLLSVDPVRLRHHVKQRTRGARRLTRLLKHQGRVFVTVLIITNVVDIFALLLATRALTGMFGRWGYLIAVLAAVPIYLFVLGVLPKSLFRRFPFRALAALAGILETASLLLWPLLEIGKLVGRLFLPRRTSDRARLFAAREELKQVAVQSEREGSLTSTERAMIHNVVDFRNVKVRDVMVPLAQCATLKPETSVEAALELSKSSGADRFPVVSAEGEAVGLVNVLDVLCDKAPATSLTKYTRRIVTVAESEPAYQIIRRLRAARLRSAAVLDAHKKLLGFATDEDLIKRLVQSA